MAEDAFWIKLRTRTGRGGEGRSQIHPQWVAPADFSCGPGHFDTEDPNPRGDVQNSTRYVKFGQRLRIPRRGYAYVADIHVELTA